MKTLFSVLFMLLFFSCEKGMYDHPADPSKPMGFFFSVDFREMLMGKEPPEIQLSGFLDSVAEGQSFKAGVRLSKPPESAEVKVTLRTSNPLLLFDGATNKELTFSPSNYTIVQEVTVSAKEDDNSVSESAVVIAGSTNSIKEKSVNLTLADDLAIIVLDTPSSLTEGEEKSIKVKFSKPIFSDKTITISSNRNALLINQSLSATLNFTPENAQTEQTVTLTSIVDSNSINEVVTLSFSTENLPKVNYTVLIEDDLGILFSGLPTTITEGTTVPVKVFLSKKPLVDFSVKINSSHSAILMDGLSSKTLSFTTQNATEPQIVNFSAINDNNSDSESSIITFSSGYTQEINYSISTVDTTVIEGSILLSGLLDTVSEGESFTMGVRLSKPPAGSVTMNISVDSSLLLIDGSNTKTLTFTEGNYSNPQNITLTAIEDSNNVSETLVLSFKAEGYSTVNRNITIADNLSIVVLNSPSSISEGGSSTIQVRLSKPIYSNKSITVSSNRSALNIGGSTSQTLNFTPENATTPQNVVLNTIIDSNSISEVTTVSFESANLPTVVYTVIVEDDLSIVVMDMPSSITEGQSTTAKVRLSKTPIVDIDVSLVSTNPSVLIDGVTNKTLNFTVANATTPQSITIYAPEDSNTFSESSMLVFSSVYTTNQMFSVTSVDITLSKGQISVSSFPNFISEGTSSTIGVKFSAGITSDTVVTISSNNPSVLVNGSNSSQLTFTSSNATIDQAVSLAAIEDANIVSENVTITFSATGYPDVTANVTAIDNDSLNISVTGSTIVSEGSTGSISVSLTQEPPFDITVNLNSLNPSSVTISPASLTFTPSNYSVAKTATLTGVEEANGTSESVTIAASSTGIPTNNFIVNTIDNDTQIVIGGASSVAEGGVAFINVSLADNPGTTRVVNLSSNNTNAVTLSNTVLSFTAFNWNQPQQVVISGIEDINVASETVILSASGTGLVGTTKTVSTIDNDTMNVIIGGATTVEEGSSSVITVVLNHQPSNNLTVNLTSGNTGSVTVGTSQLTFTPGNWNTPQNVTVNGVEDGNETSEVVSITAAIGGTNYSPYNISTIENDTKPIFAGAVNVTEGSNSVITVKLSGNPGTNRSVVLTSGNTTAITLSPVLLNFNTSNWNSEQNVIMTGVEDINIIAEPVTLTATGTGLVSNTKDVNTVDNDTMTITLSGATTVDENGSATVGVVLSHQPIPSLTVNLSSSNTDSMTVSQSTLTFTSANYNVVQNVTINGVEDANEASEQVVLTATATGASNSTRNITTIENDTRPVFSGATSVNEGGTAIIYVALSANPGGNKTVNLVSGNTGSITLSQASLVFNTGNWASPQPLTITGVQDINSFNEQVVITGSGTALAGNSVTITANDNDPQSIILAGITGVEEGGTGSITVKLAYAPGGTGSMVVNLTSSHTDSLTVSPASLTFTDANYNTEQTVTVTGVEDANETTEVVTVTATSTGVSNATKTVNTYDNDTKAMFSGATTVKEGSTAVMTVKLSANPGTNRTVVLVSGNTGAITVTPSSLNFTTANWNTNQNVTLTGVNDGNYVTETVTITANGTSLGTSSTEVTNQDVEINVQIDGVDVANGGTYTFPDKDINYTYPQIYITLTIQNTGGGTLRLTNVPVIAITGSGASHYTVTQPGTYIIPSGSSIVGYVYFNATTVGIKNASISIPNDDPDESPYTIQISGTGTTRNFVDNMNGTISYPAKNLTFMKCSQGQTWNSGTNTCTGTAGTYQYCDQTSDICNVPGYLNGMGSVSQAYNTCNSLNSGSGFAGYTNWRVPLIAELQYLIKTGVGSPTIDTGPFPNTVAFYYWSSSSHYWNGAWLVNFSSGYIGSVDKSYGNYVRCVSGL